MTDRDQVLRKIRALLQKTVANGCPVEEALAAHAKAQALIDEYQVSHEELYGTGPGGRWQKAEPEPAEPKQQQQAASKKSARTGVLFPFKTAITVGIVLIVAVLWGKSVVAGVNGPFKCRSWKRRRTMWRRRGQGSSHRRDSNRYRPLPACQRRIRCSRRQLDRHHLPQSRKRLRQRRNSPRRRRPRLR
jgi:pyruvate/2-oxoglutarate dehydrogenase complex dihydrolipoamide acyltransferase (E2) component